MAGCTMLVQPLEAAIAAAVAGPPMFAFEAVIITWIRASHTCSSVPTEVSTEVSALKAKPEYGSSIQSIKFGQEANSQCEQI